MKRNLFCFGNEFFPEDDIAILIAKTIAIPGWTCVITENPMAIFSEQEMIYILDTVKGLPNVQILTEIDDLKLSHTVSCHDLDLGFYLKLMQATGKLQSVKIIGIPFGEKNIKKVKKEVAKILETL